MNFRLKLFSAAQVALLFTYLSGCKESAEPMQQDYLMILTERVTNINNNSVEFNGSLLSLGKDEVIDQGFVWSTSEKPTINSFKMSLGKKIQAKFSLAINDLVPHQSYFVRSYAVTSKTIIYGNEETFTTLGDHSWVKFNASFSDKGRTAATGFSIGNRGFIATGFRDNPTREYLSDFWEYNSVTKAWTRLTDFPGGPRSLVVSFVIGSKAYLGGGLSKSGYPYSDFYEFDSNTKTWKVISNMPIGTFGTTSFSINGKGFVGIDYEGIFFEYNPSSDTWKQFNGPKKANYNFSFSINNRGHVVIGKELWQLNPSNYEWTRQADYPDKSTYGSFAFVLSNKVYAGYGKTGSPTYYYNSEPFSSNFYEYDPQYNVWSKLNSSDFRPLDKRLGIPWGVAWSVTWGIGDKGYLITGNAPNDPDYPNEFWLFDK